MATDQHHNPTTGSSEAITTYDRAVDDLLAYRPAILDHLGTFRCDYPSMPMGLVMSAYLHLTSTDVRDVEGARTAAAALAAEPCNEREQMHRLAIESWLDGDWVGASARLDDLLVRWPADLLALLVGHQLDFFLGDAANLRDRVGRSLGALDRGHHHEGFVLGMHAFGLEESGHYEAAEAAALAALDVHPDDVWATHAVAHVHEMRGAVDTGIGFMTATEQSWGTGNLFTVHLWWHLALFLLDQQRLDEVLAIYDREVHHAESLGVPLEMLDASALLWRLHLDDADTGGRFGPLADAWISSAGDGPWYVFNDVHAVMALAGAGRLPAARAHVAMLESYVATSSPGRSTNPAVTAAVGLPVAQAMIAFAEERYTDAVDLLLPIRRTLSRFGGSHAQRDAAQRTLVESAIRDGRHDLAHALLRERLSLRPTGGFSLSRMARLGTGSDAEQRPKVPAGVAGVDGRDVLG